jgi:hypothetical protein
MLASFASIKKALAAAVGVALTVLTFTHNLPFVPVQFEAIVGVVIGVLTPVSVWFAKNK